MANFDILTFLEYYADKSSVLNSSNKRSPTNAYQNFYQSAQNLTAESDIDQSVNINYLYGCGSLLGLLLVNQLVTGILLGCYYMQIIDFAFSSLDYIIRDVNYG